MGGGNTSLARWPVHAPDTECLAVRRSGETLHDSTLHGLEDDQEVWRFPSRWGVKPNRGRGLLL